MHYLIMHLQGFFIVQLKLWKLLLVVVVVKQNLMNRGGQINPNIDCIDTNTGISIGSILPQVNRYFVSILKGQYVSHCPSFSFAIPR